MTEWVLASASPRRASLLHQIGIAALIDPAHIDETPPPHAAPTEAARVLSEQKARTVAARHPGDSIVIGADTIVSIDDIGLGKPRNHAHAAEMLSTLAGRTHQVHTGVTIIHTQGNNCASGVATTSVTMRALDPDVIAAYVHTGEADDAAGSYAIQGRAAVFVDRIDGDYSNVVGLPLRLVTDLLAELHIQVHEQWSHR